MYDLLLVGRYIIILINNILNKIVEVFFYIVITIYEKINK